MYICLCRLLNNKTRKEEMQGPLYQQNTNYTYYNFKFLQKTKTLALKEEYYIGTESVLD
jgi:hypothetical protein